MNGKSGDGATGDLLYRPRSYYLDWTRTIAIHYVVFVHSINISELVWKLKMTPESYDDAD